MKKILPIFVLFILFLPTIVLANDCEKIPADLESARKVCDAILEIGYIIAVAGIAIAVVFIIIGGIKYITAGEKEDQTKNARKMITNALIGVAIVLTAYFLVTLVADFVAQRFL
jgi:amino acid transporter